MPRPQSAADASGAPDASAEASSPAPDAGGWTAAQDLTAKILESKSAACLVCARTNCAAQFGGCGAATGNAGAGPASGAPKAKLCTDTLACVIPSKCGVTSVSVCYCGSAPGAACMSPGAANGPCKAELERSIESTDPVDVAKFYGDDTRGGGRAMLLVTCLADNGCDSCF